ncbi:hypothetical protein SF12_05695 [Streptomyces sp. MBRL 601]|nr:hypothetical protein SF12_05695 [Streptomyces sp. MBRL 601]
MATSHDMTTPGQGSNSHLNSARMQQGSSENADRLLAERRSASLTDSHNDTMAVHYAERNAKREAEQTELAELRRSEAAGAEFRKLWDSNEIGEFMRDDPKPLGTGDVVEDMHAEAAWRERYENAKNQVEGEELAAKITNSRLAPWL